MNLVQEGIRVFDIEISALKAVRDSLGEAFETIVEEIVACKGKVIVTGMGKPGHVATKMAATFSSLGTPAFYLHPAEALHGDMGMIGEDDLVIAISYSGESEEIVGIVPPIKLIGARLVVITGNKDSTLAEAADLLQVLPNFDEACYLGLAPTSSTTVEMCYGDALAVVASGVYGFKDVDFGRLHPAGSLGKKLLFKVNDLMSTGDANPIVPDTAKLIDAIEIMSEKRLSIVNVVNDKGCLGGILTDYDLRKMIKKRIDIYDADIKDVMNNAPRTFAYNRMAVDALEYMKENNVNVVPIVDENHVCRGTLHVQQIIKAGITI